MLSALILVALVDYLFVALGEKYGKTEINGNACHVDTTWARFGAVGYFPNNASSHSAYKSSRLLVLIIIVLIISVKWLLPEVTKDF